MANAKKKTTASGMSAPVAASCAAVFVFFMFFPEINLEIKDPAPPAPLANISHFQDPESIAGLDEISDYSPMFMPTKWNASPLKTGVPTPAGWDFGVKNGDIPALALQKQSFLLDETADIERGKSALMRAVMRNFFSSYKRKEIEISKKDDSEITFKLIDMNTGETVKMHPVKISSANKMYNIAEFKVYVERDGWAMKPLELQSSGDEQNDLELSSMLSSSKLLKGAQKGEYKAVFIP